MGKYFEFIKKSILGKISLALLLVILDLGIWCFMKLSLYFSIQYVAIAAVIFTLLLILLWFLHYKLTKLACFVEIVITIALIAGVVTSNRVDSFVSKVANKLQYEVVQIVALKTSKLTSKSNLSKTKLGYLVNDPTAYSRAATILSENKKTVKKETPYKKMETEYAALQDGKVQTIVLTSLSKTALSEIDDSYTDKIKVLFTKKYPVKSATANEVNISKEPFTIYIQGVDLSEGGSIYSTGRGDVNILLTINPKTKKVNMQVIPRDTLVYIRAMNYKSKITWAAWWGGVQSSIQSIKDTFGIDVNYYVKLNFDGFADLVESLGGVDVYSYYSYTSSVSKKGYFYKFVKGMNHITSGDKALTFARERKKLPLNERSRGLQQMELVKAIFRKFAQNPTYSRAISVLNSIQTNMATNLPKGDFYKAFNVVKSVLPQLQTMQNHTIAGSMQPRYEKMLGTTKHYFIPAKGEISKVKKRVDNVINGN